MGRLQLRQNRPRGSLHVATACDPMRTQCWCSKRVWQKRKRAAAADVCIATAAILTDLGGDAEWSEHVVPEMLPQRRR
jgi:hypothetical protein